MKFILILIALTFSQTIYAETGIEVAVTLSPAGSFKATSKKIKGSAQKKGDKIIAENIELDLNSLDTGIELRNKHMKQRLLTTKYPTAKMVKAVGKGGKGDAIIEIKGKRKKVHGTYEVEGSELIAKFKMNLTDLEIKDVRYMGVGVDDEIEITVTVPITKK